MISIVSVLVISMGLVQSAFGMGNQQQNTGPAATPVAAHAVPMPNFESTTRIAVYPYTSEGARAEKEPALIKSWVTDESKLAEVVKLFRYDGADSGVLGVIPD